MAKKNSPVAALASNENIHKEFVQFYDAHNSCFIPKKILSRAVSIKTDNSDSDKIKTIENVELRVLNKVIVLYPESLAYLFVLEGCTKRLFLYLLFLHTERLTGEIRFNTSTIREFIEFCKLFGIEYKEDSVKQAMKELRENNILLNLQRGKNLINPMITGASEKARTSAIKEYSFQLAKKGHDAVADFFPRYT